MSLNDPQEKLRCVFFDLTEEKLFECFINPYRQGKNFFSANEIIQVCSIRKVQIIKTERKSEIELKEIEEQTNKKLEEFNRASTIVNWGYVCYTIDYIINVGKDVTDIYISGPPGYANEKNSFLHIVNNQWISTILTGLIVAAIAAWLGLS